MKKLLLTASLALFSFFTFAQIPSIGIKGGVNFATMSNSNSSSYSTSGALTTFNAGAFVDLKFGNVSLQPALNFTGKGGSYTETVFYPDATTGHPGGAANITVKEKLYYLQLPVNLVFHIPVIIGNIYFGAGPYIAEGLSGKTDYNGSSQDVKFGSDPEDVNQTQFGLNAIVGFKLKGGLLINANYDLGLTNDVPASEGSDRSKSRVFGVSLGYVFL